MVKNSDTVRPSVESFVADWLIERMTITISHISRSFYLFASSAWFHAILVILQMIAQTISSALSSAGSYILDVCINNGNLCGNPTKMEMAIPIFVSSIAHDMGFDWMCGNLGSDQEDGWLPKYQESRSYCHVGCHLCLWRTLCNLPQQEFVRTTAFYKLSWQNWIIVSH